MKRRACFFDLYNTLVYFYPSREERQAEACRRFGLEVDPATLHLAYVTGEHFWTIENGRFPIQKRSKEARQEFYAEYERALLAAAGLEVNLPLALKIHRTYRQMEAKLRLFDDVSPTLIALKQSGLCLGLISNAEMDVSPLCQDLGIGGYLDVVISSHVIGFEKPDVRIFDQALRSAAVDAAFATHVGDQYHSDVVGARRAGITPVLLDRFGFLTAFDDCPRVRSLSEVPGLLGLYEDRAVDDKN